ncbi:hypothetical protein BH18ACI4_BH18ACI4_10200 [soil metagenome]
MGKLWRAISGTHTDERMEIIESTKDKTIVSLSSTELIIMNNALNEICNGVDIPEFETRVGYSRQQVEALLDQIHPLTSSEQPQP